MYWIKTNDITITLIEPDNQRSDVPFKCSKANFGTYEKKYANLAKTGRWVYMITTTESYESIYIQVTSRSRTDNDDPIRTKCWIKTGEQQLGEDVLLKLSAVAEVMKGTMPIIGAEVTAYITRPGDGASTPPLELQLLDNGAGMIICLIF